MGTEKPCDRIKHPDREDSSVPRAHPSEAEQKGFIVIFLKAISAPLKAGVEMSLDRLKVSEV